MQDFAPDLYTHRLYVVLVSLSEDSDPRPEAKPRATRRGGGADDVSLLVMSIDPDDGCSGYRIWPG